MKPEPHFTTKSLMKNWMAESVILAVVLVTFGLRANQLGLYGNQWKQVLVSASSQTQYKIGTFLQSILIGWFGESAVLYHLLNAILLCLLGILVYRWMMHQMMGQSAALAITLLFLVFPGFAQMSSAFELSPLLAGLIFVVLSMELFGRKMEWDKKKEYAWFIAGSISTLLAAALTPETALVEVIAFIFIIIKDLRQKHGHILATAGVFFIPLLMVLPSVLINQRPQISLKILTITIKQWVDLFILSWRTIIAIPNAGAQVFGYVVILFAGIVALYFIFKKMAGSLNSNLNKVNEEVVPVLFSAISGFALLFLVNVYSITTIPGWQSNPGVLITGFFAAIFIVTVIKVLFLEKYQFIILAILIGLSAGARDQNINRYEAENLRLNSYLGQWQARADGFQPETKILVEQLPFDFTDLESVEALLNHRIGMGRENGGFQIIPADNQDVREFLANSDMNSMNLRIGNRDIELEKNHLVASTISQKGCLQVLETGETDGMLAEGLKLASIYSEPDKIIVNNMSDVLQLEGFRTTIEPVYCFDIQMMYRYYASSRWDDVIRTYEKLPDYSGKGTDISLSRPVIGALLRVGNPEEALKLMDEFGKEITDKKNLCPLWTEVLSDKSSSEEVNDKVQSVFPQTGCQ